MTEIAADLYLKPDIAKAHPEGGEFADEGVVRPIADTGFKKPAFEIGVKLKDGDVYRWTMNMTSQRTMAAAYGKEAKNWIGKGVLWEVERQKVGKDMKDVIYAVVPEQKEK